MIGMGNPLHARQKRDAALLLLQLRGDVTRTSGMPTGGGVAGLAPQTTAAT